MEKAAPTAMPLKADACEISLFEEFDCVRNSTDVSCRLCGPHIASGSVFLDEFMSMSLRKKVCFCLNNETFVNNELSGSRI